MPVNGNDTREIIDPPFTTFPYPAVAAIDVRYLWQLPNGTIQSRGGNSSGIFITPNHVLTAGHSVYGRTEGQARAIRVTTSNVQYTLNSRNIGAKFNL